MTLQEIREIARSRGISPGRRGKVDLIKALQSAEGNFDCFATATAGVCDRQDCLWRGDCLEVSTRGLAA